METGKTTPAPKLTAEQLCKILTDRVKDNEKKDLPSEEERVAAVAVCGIAAQKAAQKVGVAIAEASFQASVDAAELNAKLTQLTKGKPTGQTSPKPAKVEGTAPQFSTPGRGRSECQK